MRIRKSKPQEAAETPQQPQRSAKALGRSAIVAAAHQLRPAPWNPRPEITSESVADLTASVASVGLIQPIVVMRDPEKPSVDGTDFYLIVAGHRRFKACVDAGLMPIPCELLDVEVEVAKRMTFLENLQRKEADPLLESELVKSLLDGGMTQAEIAAETGRGERWVARRANLTKLSKGWRERIRKGEKFTTDCLEHIAAYPEEMQEKLKDANGYNYTGERDVVTWGNIGYRFRNESRDLERASFNTKACLSCANNTGCSPDLFDLDGGKNAQLGRCLCERCWREKHEDHVAKTVAKQQKQGVEIIRKKPDSLWAATDRKTKEYTALYVYKDGDQTVAKWFRPPEKPTAEDKEEMKKIKAAENERKRKLKLVLGARNLIRDALEDMIESGGVESLKAREDAFNELAAVRLETELTDGIRYPDELVDAFARIYGLEGVEMPEEAMKAYKEELAEQDAQDAQDAQEAGQDAQEAGQDAQEAGETAGGEEA